MNSIQHRNPCKYQTVDGQCGNPAEFCSLYCADHEKLIREIDDLEKEVNRVIHGGKKHER